MKHTHDKFKTDLMHVGATLRKHRIATIESHVHPNFDNPENPIYAEVVLTVQNQSVLGNLINFINQQEETEYRVPAGFDKPEYNLETGRCTLRIKPYPSLDKSCWLSETEQFLSHLRPIVKDYRQKFRHRI